MTHIHHIPKIFLLFLILFPISSTSATPTCGARTTLFLQSPVSYINICRCPRDQPPVISRIDSSIPLPSNTTLPSTSQASASLSCFLNRNPQLASACDHGIPTYRRAVEHAFADCVTNTPSPSDVKLPFPLGSKNGKCEGLLFIFDDGQPALSLVLACNCQLDDENRISIVSGRAMFQPKSDMEKEQVEICTRADLGLLDTVCRTNPEDFEVLAKQVLQTCCKRSRVSMGDKLECQAIVPDDLEALGFLTI